MIDHYWPVIVMTPSTVGWRPPPFMKQRATLTGTAR